MIKYTYLVFSFIVLIVKTSHGARESRNVSSHLNVTCDQTLSDFSYSLSNVIFCSSSYSWPFTLCQNCADNYYDVAKAYNTILSTIENDSRSCEDVMLSADRVQVVKLLFETVSNVWIKSSCDDCFYILRNDTAHADFVLSNDTVAFNKLHRDTKICFQEANKKKNKIGRNDEVCTKCARVYEQLNELYEGFHKGLDVLCMDTVDKMNVTRAQWSYEYGCVTHNFSFVVFYTTSSLLLTLAVLFYLLSLIILAAQQECILPRNSNTADSNEPEQV
ncbi:Osteopetrosis associated transmembrane protein 1 [Chamberlinius hualienensis]